MKTFVSFRFSGEDPKTLEPLLTQVRDTLAAKGVEVYCTFFDEAEFKDKAMGPRQILDHAFRVIDDCDFLFVVQTSDSKSEGMLMEVGYCLAKNIPVIVATHDSVKSTYVPDMAVTAFKWSDPDDLSEKIKKIGFTK